MRKVLISIFLLITYSFSKESNSIIQFTQLNYTDIKCEIFYEKGEKINSIIEYLHISNKEKFFNYLKKNDALKIESYKLAKLITNYPND